MRRLALLAVLAALALAAWLAYGAPRIPSRGAAMEQKNSAASADSLSRPSPASNNSSWLQASHAQFATRAEDYELDAPRKHNELGQALPFRERSWTQSQAKALEHAAEGETITLSLFDDTEFRARVTGRWQDERGTRVAALLEGRGPRDRFFMSWGDGYARGLVQLPSINRAYEIVQVEGRTFVVREWLLTDVVCATPTQDGSASDAGFPKPEGAQASSASASPIAPGDVPSLQSRPGVRAVIYIDFDGEVVSGSAWGATINAPAARMNAAQVTEAWERVSRDFAPFTVNVTTDRSVYEAAPANLRTHCVVTQDDTAAPGAGGVAWLYSFNNSDPAYKICWSFIDDHARNCAVVVSHEVGHTLALNHDGRVASGSLAREEYYKGHGLGATGWAPVMGAGYYQQLVQWSKGEYARADNQEDDLAIITAASRIPYYPDEHGGTIAAATPLVSGVAVTGLVERNTDEDYFRLLVGIGPQPVSVALPVGTMLDVELKIFAEDGTLLDTINPVDELPASTVLNFPTSRTVLLRVAGTGKPDVLVSGYSSYSSLGAYTLVAGDPFPGKVIGVSAMPYSESVIGIGWSAAPAATAYVVRRDGSDVAVTSGLSFLDSGLAELTSHTYTVVATNNVGAAEPSDPVSATTLSWVAAHPYGFRVTTPASIVTTNATNYLFSGQMGEGLAGGLIQWTNAGRNRSGYLTNAATNWSQLIPLFAGTNRVIFSASYARPIGTNITAYDGAGDWTYQSQGWVTGANGGYGFGPWTNAVTSTDNASLTVTDEWSAPNMSVGTFHGFTLRASGGSFAIARRLLDAPLAVGSSFTVNFDSNLLDAGRTVGFSLADSGDTDRFSFFASGGPTNYYGIRDGAGTNTNTGITYTTNGLLPVTFTMVTSNSYRLVAGTNAPISNTLVTGGPISRLVVSNSSAGSSIDNAFYLGDMSIFSPVTTNELVRAAAYVVQPASTSTDGIPDAWWSTHFPGNSSAWIAANDPDGDGQSNAAEYAAGTSPVDGSSKFAIISIGRAGANVSITWSAVVNKVYTVETNASVASANWQPVPPSITNTSGTTNLGTNVPMADPGGFLRVRVAP